MHAIKLMLIYWLMYKISGIDEETCFKSHGIWIKERRMKSQYSYLEIPFLRFVKVNCRSRPLTIQWMKDEIVIQREFMDKTHKTIKTVLKFYNLSESNNGNYTLLLISERFNFSYHFEIIVTEASSYLKTIRRDTIPYHLQDIVKDRLYWMPRMTETTKYETISSYDDHTIYCWFCSSSPVNNASVIWLLRRSWLRPNDAEESLPLDSRISTALTEIDCSHDSWMPDFNGHCYVSELNFKPFLSTDSGEYICSIDNSLRTSFVLFEQLTSFKRRVEPSNILKMTNSTTICAGSRIILKCSSKLVNNPLSLTFTNASGHSTFITSTDTWVVSHRIAAARQINTGTYICNDTSNHRTEMFLSVTKCVSYTLPLAITISLIFLLIPVLVVIIYCRCVKIRQRFYLNNKIHSLTNLKDECMHRNERYIPLIQDVDLEIPRENVRVSTEVLGAGEFGTVFRGTLRSRPVAIKIANHHGNDMLVQEIKMLKELGYHEHVIQLLGICSSDEPLMAILELADGGNLRQYLRDHNPLLRPSCEQIGMEQLLSFVTEIASGMQYLASKNVIHRDLAARNCLLTKDMSVKLSDFGLTRLAVNYYENESQDPSAVAWVAPEALGDAVLFTTKSDVWSFGIVMWEVFQLGACPYPSMSSAEIIEAVRLGVVNSQPPLASEAVYGIMTRCWALEANDRPTFADLREQLDEVDVNEYL